MRCIVGRCMVKRRKVLFSKNPEEGSVVYSAREAGCSPQFLIDVSLY